MGKIYISQYDRDRLEGLINYAESTGAERDKKYLEALQNELDQANIVLPHKIPPDVVTMNSQVRVRDLDTGKEGVYSIVFPGLADPANHSISVLSPVGTALIGARQGNVVEWEVPSGRRRLCVVELIYQPESAGDYDL